MVGVSREESFKSPLKDLLVTSVNMFDTFMMAFWKCWLISIIQEAGDRESIICNCLFGLSLWVQSFTGWLRWPYGYFHFHLSLTAIIPPSFVPSLPLWVYSKCTTRWFVKQSLCTNWSLQGEKWGSHEESDTNLWIDRWECSSLCSSHVKPFPGEY